MAGLSPKNRTQYAGETNGTFKANLHYLLKGADGKVIGVHQNVGTRNGKQLDVMCCIVFDVKDGQIVEGREVFYDLYSWDAFRA